MTTMNDPGTSGQQSGYGPETTAPRMLRRSRRDRVVSGVAGGLGEYFRVDAVIFRVLFAVLAFFGGVGLLAYALAWLLLPEPDVGVSALDKALVKLREHRVPPWLVIAGGTLLLWACWFSWWAPGPTFPALLLLAVVAMVLVHRLGSRPDAPPAATGPVLAPPPGGVADTTVPPAPGVPPTPGTVAVNLAKAPQASLLWPTSDQPMPDQPTPGMVFEPGTAGDPSDSSAAGDSSAAAPPVIDPAATTRQFGDLDWQPPAAPTAPLIAPLSDTRRSMQAWIAETSNAHRVRVQRRRPIKVGVGLALVAGWAIVALLDAFTRVPFPAYLWVGLAILGGGLVLSLVTRRLTLSLLVPMALLAVVAIGLGGTRASLRDGSGQIGWMPTAASQLTDHRQFAGQSTLDLTALAPLGSPASLRITQAAGEVKLRIPASLNATVISDVHTGDIQSGQSQQTGQHVSGLNVHLELAAPAGVSGQPLTIYVNLTIGHVQVDRV
ncbi:MAG: PspC domain-containing protein [Jatrophihabitans sp.]